MTGIATIKNAGRNWKLVSFYTVELAVLLVSAHYKNDNMKKKSKEKISINHSPDDSTKEGSEFPYLAPGISNKRKRPEVFRFAATSFNVVLHEPLEIYGESIKPMLGNNAEPFVTYENANVNDNLFEVCASVCEHICI